MVFRISIWRCSLKLLPSTIFFAILSCGLWQIVAAAERNVIFYGFMALFSGFAVLPFLAWLRCIFGKPPLTITPENLIIHYWFKAEEKIAWQDITNISYHRVLGYHWSSNEVDLSLVVAKKSTIKRIPNADILQGGAVQVAKNLAHHWKMYR